MRDISKLEELKHDIELRFATKTLEEYKKLFIKVSYDAQETESKDNPDYISPQRQEQLLDHFLSQVANFMENDI